jgi:hypothetical protein
MGPPRRLRHLTLVAAFAFCAPVSAAHAANLPAPLAAAAPIVAAPDDAAVPIVAAVDASQSSPPPTPQPPVAPPAVAAPTTPAPNQLTHPVESIGSLSPPPVALETRTGGAATRGTPARAAAKPDVAPARRVVERTARPGAGAPADSKPRDGGPTGLKATVARELPQRAVQTGSTARGPENASRPATEASDSSATPGGLADDGSPFGATNSSPGSLLLVAVALVLFLLVPPRLPGRLVPTGESPRGLRLKLPLERPG